MYKSSIISALAHFVPERSVSNHDLAKLMTTSDEWITERTGIKTRRFVEPGISSSDLALSAIENLKKKHGIDCLNEVDLIIAATLSPDFYFPGIGTIIQHKLGLGNIPALDIRAQCSGLVYGLECVNAFIASGRYKKILLICSEVQSPALELSDRGRDMAVLFGDGAGVLLIEAQDCEELPRVDNGLPGIIDTVLGSDGSGSELLCLRAPGTRTPGFLNEEIFTSGAWHPHMDGRLVFKNAVTRMTDVLEIILKRNNLDVEQISWLFPHQANLRINDAVRERFGIPIERVLNNIQKYGNTTAATIPILMSEAVQAGQLKSGDLVLTVAFGAGFTWGSNLIRWG